MFRVRGHDKGRTAQTESLGGQQHVDIESRGICRGSAYSSRLGPQFRCKAKRIVSPWDVPIRRGVHECIKAGNTNRFVHPQELAFDLVIDNSRYHNVSARAKAVLEPICDRDDLMATLWLRYQTERPRIKEKNVAHG